MKKELINTTKQGMLGILNNEQLAKLHGVLELSFTLFAENRVPSAIPLSPWSRQDLCANLFAGSG